MTAREEASAIKRNGGGKKPGHHGQEGLGLREPRQEAGL
jgi:hypothetical protein